LIDKARSVLFGRQANGAEFIIEQRGRGLSVALKKRAASTGKMANCVKDQQICAKTSISCRKFKFSATRRAGSFSSLYESPFNLRYVNADLTCFGDEFRLHGCKTGL
jgi:hypothetical protein